MTRKNDISPVKWAWALSAPGRGVWIGSISTTRSAAIASYWSDSAADPAIEWPKLRREGWRVVRVEIKPIYFSSSSAKMKRVPQ